MSTENSVTEDNLQGSWVELHFNNNGGGGGAVAAVAQGVEEEQGAAPSTQGVVEQEAEPRSSTQGVVEQQEMPRSSTQGVVEQEAEPRSSTQTVVEQQRAAAPSASAQGVLDLERMLLDAQHESGRSSSRSSVPCDSPPRPQTPLHLRRGSEVHSSGEKSSSQSDEDYLERRREVENLMKKNADWIWDWSSRPENIPPKEFLLKHPKRPTNPLSIRNTSVMKKGGIFSAEFLKVFLPSLLISHILAVGLGMYIGRRLTTSTSTF